MNVINGTVLHLVRIDGSIENILSTTRDPNKEIKKLTNEQNLRFWLDGSPLVKSIDVYSTQMTTHGEVCGLSEFVMSIDLGELSSTDIQ